MTLILNLAVNLAIAVAFGPELAFWLGYFGLRVRR